MTFFKQFLFNLSILGIFGLICFGLAYLAVFHVFIFVTIAALLVMALVALSLSVDVDQTF